MQYGGLIPCGSADVMNISVASSKSPREKSARGGFVYDPGLGRFGRSTSRLSGGSRGERNTAACPQNPDRTRDLPTFHFPAAGPCPALWTPIWTPHSAPSAACRNSGLPPNSRQTSKRLQRGFCCERISASTNSVTAPSQVHSDPKLSRRTAARAKAASRSSNTESIASIH